MSSSFTRSRSRGGFAPALWSYKMYTGNGALMGTYSGTQPNSDGAQGVMTDVVTKPFIAGKTVVNSPMERSETTRARSVYAYKAWHSNPNPSSHGSTIGTIENPSKDVQFDSYLAQLPIDLNSLVTLASTKALAQVKSPEVAGLVSIAEAKATVQSLLNPVQGALNFLARNAPAKRKLKRRSKRNLKASAKALADQHLTVVFGLMPFISDIKGILKALESFEPWPVRMTARGSASTAASMTPSTSVVTYSDSSSTQTTTDRYVINRAVEVRAFQLYEAKVSIQSALGLDLSEIPKALWQTTTLSFVVDWFANVGDYISAMTPKIGVTYLASGYTVSDVTACSNDLVMVQGRKGTASTWWNAEGSSNQSRVVVAKRRVPASLFDYRGIRLKSNMRSDILDTFKITAGISLITQRLVALK